nr:hypothetical protein [Marasmius tenuissimus]
MFKFFLYRINCNWIFSKLLDLFCYLCLVVLIIKCYNDINYIFNVLENVIYFRVILWIYKKFILKFINNKFYKLFLFILLLALLSFNILLFIYLYGIFSSINFDLFSKNLLFNYESDYNSSCNIENTNYSTNNNTTDNNTNTSTDNSTNSNTDNLSWRAWLTESIQSTMNLRNISLDIPNGIFVDTFIGVGGLSASSRLAGHVMAHTQSLPIGTRIITTIGTFLVGAGGTLLIQESNRALRDTTTQNSAIVLRVERVEFSNQSDTNTPGQSNSGLQSGNSGSSTSSNNTNNSRDMFIDDTIKMDTNITLDGDLVSNSLIDTRTIPILSVNENELSNLEIIFNNLFNLEILILTLSVMIINIYIVRYLFKYYKDVILRIIGILSNKNLNMRKIIDNVLIYNLKFYNFIILINLLLIIIFKLVYLYFIYLLESDILNFIINYLLNKKLIIPENGELIIKYQNIIINTYLENTLFYLLINNMLFIILVLVNAFMYFFLGKINNKILICSIFIFLILQYIDIYYINELNNNLDFYINDYVVNHILM